MTSNTDHIDTQAISVVEEDIHHTIQRGQAGDKDALPAIRAVLDTYPVLSGQKRPRWPRTSSVHG